MPSIRQKASEKLAKKQVIFVEFHGNNKAFYHYMISWCLWCLHLTCSLCVSLTGSLLQQSFIILQGHGTHALFHVQTVYKQSSIFVPLKSLLFHFNVSKIQLTLGWMPWLFFPSLRRLLISFVFWFCLLCLFGIVYLGIFVLSIHP